MKKNDGRGSYALPSQDEELFSRMEKESISKNEESFFAAMMKKEQEEMPVSVFDVIMDSNNNPDGIFIDKRYHSEYKIGRFFDGVLRVLPVYPISLSEALGVNLVNLLDKDITLWQWLRDIDYVGVSYDYPWE